MNHFSKLFYLLYHRDVCNLNGGAEQCNLFILKCIEKCNLVRERTRHINVQKTRELQFGKFVFFVEVEFILL